MHVQSRSRPSSRTLALATLAAALLAALATATPASAQVAVPTKVAVINVATIRSKIQEWKELRDHITATQGLIDTSRKGHQAQLDDMVHHLQSLKPESDAFSDLMVKIDEQKATWELQDGLMARTLGREINTRQKKIYEDMIAATAAVAKKHGLDLVLVNNDLQLPPNVQDVPNEQLSNAINQRLLMFVSDKIDVSDEVATEMDRAFKAGSATPGH
jgi:Skp family chaperone for outer membrane proteins